MKVVIAPDKFKGTLSAPQVAAAMAEGVRRAHPQAEIDLAPLADGGEGTAECLRAALGGEAVMVDATGPMSERIGASFAMLANGSAAIDMASASGLHLVEPSSRSALSATSLGTGELMRIAAREGANQVLVCIGGSASTDAGTGAARANGWDLIGVSGAPVALGGGPLAELDRIDPPERPFELPIVGVCDVMSPLLGPDGAARVFAPQKGATPDDVARLESGLEVLAEVIADSLGRDVSSGPGAGSGGGMGAGLLAFFDGSLRAGFEFVAENVGLEERVAAADLVITGEGSIDAQSLLGKVVGGVADLARGRDVPCVAVGGRVDAFAAARIGLTATASLTDLFGAGRAVGSAERSIASAAEDLAKAV
jgi:glycerate 2-kinase